MNIKKLSLPSSITYFYIRHKNLNHLIFFEPPFKFGKEGYYFYNNVSWYELKDGTCFLADKESFKTELLVAEINEMTIEQKQSILNFVQHAPKKFLNPKIINYANYIEYSDHLNDLKQRLEHYKYKKRIGLIKQKKKDS